MDCNEQFQKDLKRGEEYQKFIEEIFREKLGIVFSCYTTKSEQMRYGENRAGWEIKYCSPKWIGRNGKPSGNIFIETEAKNKDNTRYIPGGINKEDNAWLFIVGDYDDIWIFSKKMLKTISHNKMIINNSMGTAKGFLLNSEEIENYSIHHIKINE